MVMVKSALQGIPVSHLMITSFDTLSPKQPLSEAIRRVLAGSQEDFPVVENERVVGVLTQANLLSALASRGQEIPVEEAMEDRPRQLVGDLLRPRKVGDVEECVVRLREWDCLLLEAVREPVVAIHHELHAKRRPRRDPQMAEAEHLVHEVEIVVQALPLPGTGGS